MSHGVPVHTIVVFVHTIVVLSCVGVGIVTSYAGAIPSMFASHHTLSTIYPLAID